MAVLPELQPLQIDSAPADCSTLGVSFEHELAQYSGEAQILAAVHSCASNASVSESGLEEEPRLEEHLIHGSMGVRGLERKCQYKLGTCESACL